MLRVTIELVPHGDERRKRTLGVLEIANDGTSDDTRRGNYMVRWPGKDWRRSVVKDFPRLTRTCWDLLFRVLASTQAEGHRRLLDELAAEIRKDQE